MKTVTKTEWLIGALIVAYWLLVAAIFNGDVTWQ